MTKDEAIETLIDHDATKGGGAKEDGWILLSSSQDLNSQLACAPFAISVLSTLNLVAAEGRDFELVEKEDIPKFKHLKIPNSFRATISNLSNEACNAFIHADGSMHRIWLTMRQVPKHVEGAMKVMVQGQGEDITNFLPIHLEALSSDAKKCKEEAKMVLESFEKVSSILDDLTDAIILNKGKSEGTSMKALGKIKQLKEERKRIQDDEERNREEYKKTYIEYQRRSTQLDKELDYQGSWGQVFKEGVTTLLSAFKSQTPQVNF